MDRVPDPYLKSLPRLVCPSCGPVSSRPSPAAAPAEPAPSAVSENLTARVLPYIAPEKSAHCAHLISSCLMESDRYQRGSRRFRPKPPPPPPPPPPGRLFRPPSPFGKASFTLIARPFHSRPSSSVIAASASALTLISTN